MNSTSRYALLAALGLAVAAIAPGTPAFAKKKDEAPKEKPFTVSPEVLKQLNLIDAAVAKKDVPGAEAAVAAAEPLAKTPDEKFAIAQKMIGVAQLSADNAKISAAVDQMIDTGEAAGRLDDKQRSMLYFYRGRFAYVDQNYAKAAEAFALAQKTGSTDEQVPILLSDSIARSGKPAEGLATLQSAIDARIAAGQPVPASWYETGSNTAAVANLVGPYVTISSAWLAAYPARDAWAKILNNYRAIGQLAAGPDTDLLRLARASGSLTLMKDRDYRDLFLAVYRAYPAEAVDVIKEGVAAGKINMTTDRDAREILPLSEGKLAADKASLGASAAAANGPRASFQSVMATADAYASYKEFAKAGELYKLALTKPGADANLANLRLGATLAQSGDKAGALAALNSITGKPYSDIAAFWKVWIEHPAAS